MNYRYKRLESRFSSFPACYKLCSMPTGRCAIAVVNTVELRVLCVMAFAVIPLSDFLLFSCSTCLERIFVV